MRTRIATVELLLAIPLAAGCGRAGAAIANTADEHRPVVVGILGDCPAGTGPMRPAPGATADRNGDRYVCSLYVRSIAGDTMHLEVDNDAPPGNEPRAAAYTGM